MSPKLHAKLQAAMTALDACNQSSAMRAYDQAIRVRWDAQSNEHRLEASFNVQGKAFQRAVREVFRRILPKHYARISFNSGFNISHGTHPPTIRPYLSLEVASQHGQGWVLKRHAWPSRPEHIEQLARKIRAAMLVLETESEEAEPQEARGG